LKKYKLASVYFHPFILLLVLFTHTVSGNNSQHYGRIVISEKIILGQTIHVKGRFTDLSTSAIRLGISNIYLIGKVNFTVMEKSKNQKINIQWSSLDNDGVYRQLGRSLESRFITNKDVPIDTKVRIKGDLRQILAIFKQTTKKSTSITGHNLEQRMSDYDSIIQDAAVEHQLNPELIKAVIRVESSFMAQAVSHAGALGLMQLMPATAEMYGVSKSELFDPEINIKTGSKHLSRLFYKVYDGDLELTLAAYNAGVGTVRKYNYSVPPFPETEDFIKKVTFHYDQYKALSIAYNRQSQYLY